ncbi:MAG TPA: beta-ketoacyl synthase chain length factor [Burkholderiales bacterium]|nr:beta-ketoacyl synthase chain length factor [Burkholderiales bacterium]
MRVFVEGVGLIGPGLGGWAASRAVLAGTAPYRPGPTVVAASDLLPAAERRRAGMPVKLALAAGHEALAAAARDAATTATVFASSSGDCDNVHHMLEALATPERQISPTRFHNSVHNAAAGYWSIATRCHAPSTSLACRDGSFAAGLLEAASQVSGDGATVALIAYDHPYPEPLHSARPIIAAFGVALVLTPRETARSVAVCEVIFAAQEEDVTRVADPGLESLRTGVPAARSLPLLGALARGSSETVLLEYVSGTHLRVAAAPCS